MVSFLVVFTSLFLPVGFVAIEPICCTRSNRFLGEADFVREVGVQYV
jgi:hypothetical protein